ETLKGVTERTGSGGKPFSGPGGLLDLGSNNGLRSRNRLTYVQEVGLNVGYQISRHLSAGVGYTFLYWDDVARPGGQLSRNLNPQLIPSSHQFGGPGGAPPHLLNCTGFWFPGGHTRLDTLSST